MTDPTTALFDLSAHLPALVAGRVMVRGRFSRGASRSGQAWTLLGFRDVGFGAEVVVAHPDSGTLLVTLDRNPDLSIVLDPHTVRALAVALAEAVGLDVSGGATASYVQNGRMTLLEVRGARGFVRFTSLDLWPWRHVPALADIDPTHPHAPGLALVAALRATPARGAA